MRTANALTTAAVVAFGLVLTLDPSPTLSLDGTPSPNAVQPSPVDAFRAGAEALRTGEKDRAVSSLQYAADHGHGVALWQLGRMYAEGDGVKRDDVRAFEYFRKFADSHADDNPQTPRARFVAHAFVSLGHYYLDGIPNSTVSANPERARRMFSHAASYFGDPEAQYQLAMLYVDGIGVTRDPKRAVPWLTLSARKGHYKAQAVLGRILFKGEHGERQPATGGNVPWIAEARESAVKQASEQDRVVALQLLERWVGGGGRRE
jgi:TPR repeat protein